MKKIIILFVIAFVAVSVQAKDKYFLEKYATICNETGVDSIQIERLSQKELLEALNDELESDENEHEKADILSFMEEVKKCKEMLLGFLMESSLEDETLKKIAMLKGSYEELISFEKDNYSVRYLVSSGKKKTDELVVLLYMNMLSGKFPLGMELKLDPTLMLNMVFEKPMKKEDVIAMISREDGFSIDRLLSGDTSDFVEAQVPHLEFDLSKKEECDLKFWTIVFDDASGAYGVMHNNGNEIIPQEYDEISLLEETLYDKGENHVRHTTYGFLVKKDGKQGLFTVTGDVTFTPIYDEIKPFVHQGDLESLLLRIGDKWGLGNEDDEVFIPIDYRSITSLADNNIRLEDFDGTITYAVVESKVKTLVLDRSYIIYGENPSLYGVNDTKGEVILPREYDMISSLVVNHHDKKSNTHYYKPIGFLVEKGGKKGILAPPGHLFFKVEYDEITPFIYQGKVDYMLLKKDGKYGLSTTTDDDAIIPIEYKSITVSNDDRIRLEAFDGTITYYEPDQE